jgi:acetoin utilization deacetylase AcuC-like enzyme
MSDENLIASTALNQEVVEEATVPVSIEQQTSNIVDIEDEMKALAIARRRLTVFWHPACEMHYIPDHPEQPLRVSRILAALRTNFEDKVKFQEACKAKNSHLELLHAKKLIDRFNMLCDRTIKQYEENGKIVQEHVDGDTSIMHGTKEAAYRAAGSVIMAIDSIFTSEPTVKIDTAFCCVRPPGHHAVPKRSMGFCHFNNAAIGALYARQRYGKQRAAVLDFDVHHGNGTEEAFIDDEDLFYGSTHQKGSYPGTGKDPSPYVGAMAKYEFQRRIVNRLIRTGPTNRDDFRKGWLEILQEMHRFGPQIVIISAGFDAHEDDPLADSALIAEDFYWATEQVRAICEMLPGEPVPVLSVLEGGYDLDAISASAVEHVRALLADTVTLDKAFESQVEVAGDAKEEDKVHNGDEVSALKSVLQMMGIQEPKSSSTNVEK